MPEGGAVRTATDADVAAIVEVVNDAARAYRGVIAADCWHEPYMSEDALRADIAAGVRFWVRDVNGVPAAVMGLQRVADVALIRHAYVRSAHQRGGLGGHLLGHLRSRTDEPMLVGTWRAAGWAARFYRQHGFRLLGRDAAQRLLRRYWTVPERQMEESVVLADAAWLAANQPAGGTPGG